jgi:hypothetical protein
LAEGGVPGVRGWAATGGARVDNGAAEGVVGGGVGTFDESDVAVGAAGVFVDAMGRQR